MRAYITQTTISTGSLRHRGNDKDIYSDRFHPLHQLSDRRASKPRDYIFATMPQFLWYHYPQNAEKMSWSEIFIDFWKQATNSGHGFICRFTKGMTDPNAKANAWEPSSEQPGLQCLGDFLKLLGQRIDRTTAFPENEDTMTISDPRSKKEHATLMPEGVGDIHLTTIV